MICDIVLYDHSVTIGNEIKLQMPSGTRRVHSVTGCHKMVSIAPSGNGSYHSLTNRLIQKPSNFCRQNEWAEGFLKSLHKQNKILSRHLYYWPIYMKEETQMPQIWYYLYNAVLMKWINMSRVRTTFGRKYPRASVYCETRMLRLHSICIQW